jgi:hypothetical protein
MDAPTAKSLRECIRTKDGAARTEAREVSCTTNASIFHDEDDIASNVPDEIPIEVDLGFQGWQKQYENVYLPHKKPRGGELSDPQKQENRSLSQSRVLCENAFARVKRYSSVSHVYRNRTKDFDDNLMLTATGLWNFYLVAA